MSSIANWKYDRKRARLEIYVRILARPPNKHYKVHGGGPTGRLKEKAAMSEPTRRVHMRCRRVYISLDDSLTEEVLNSPCTLTSTRRTTMYGDGNMSYGFGARRSERYQVSLTHINHIAPGEQVF